MFSLPSQWGYHCSTSQIFQVRYSHCHPQHTCRVQFPSHLTCNGMQHPSLLPLFSDTGAQLAKCTVSLKQKEARINLLLPYRLSQSYPSAFEGWQSQMASHSWERHTRSSPLSHQRKKQGNLWNWEQTRISVQPEDKGSSRPDFKIATDDRVRWSAVAWAWFQGNLPLSTWATGLRGACCSLPHPGTRGPFNWLSASSGSAVKKKKGEVLQPSYLLNS